MEMMFFVRVAHNDVIDWFSFYGLLHAITCLVSLNY